MVSFYEKFERAIYNKKSFHNVRDSNARIGIADYRIQHENIWIRTLLQQWQYLLSSHLALPCSGIGLVIKKFYSESLRLSAPLPDIILTNGNHLNSSCLGACRNSSTEKLGLASELNYILTTFL